MSDLLMDFSTNDVAIKNGDLSLVSGALAIQQDLQQRLQVWLGEWFLDTTFGVPYRQQILVKNPSLDLIQADLVTAILDTPGVEQILDFNFDYDSTNRRLSVQTSVQTSDGQIIQAQTDISAPQQPPTIEGTPYP